jgi:GTP-binding protein Era
VVIAVNKTDLLNREQTVAVLEDAAALDLDAEIYPVSALRRNGVDDVTRELIARMPEGEFMYPPEEHTDLSDEVRLAELIREQVLERTREEIPHAVEVEIDEIEEREDGLLWVVARMWAETESQKGILIGKGGQMVRAIGMSARSEIQKLTGRRVHLDLSVRVRKGWRADEALLDRLGID